MVTNIYKNIPTDEKIKLYLRFCDYIAKDQIEDEKDKCKLEAGSNSQQATEMRGRNVRQGTNRGNAK